MNSTAPEMVRFMIKRFSIFFLSTVKRNLYGNIYSLAKLPYMVHFVCVLEHVIKAQTFLFLSTF